MLWHDRLSILWDKATKAWLRRLKCPIDWWKNRTWADRFVRLRGKYNDQVVQYYKNGLSGDSPELMPLDSHLFADRKKVCHGTLPFPSFWTMTTLSNIH